MASLPPHELAPPPIARILAVDDLLGKVYASCSSSGKRAFRHTTAACYKSPTICAQLSSYDTPPHSRTEDITAMLATYPRHAQLQDLTINAPVPSFSALFKHLLQSDNAYSSRARATLSNVVKLKLAGSLPLRLGSFDATAVALLFPRFRDPHSNSSLNVQTYQDPEDPFWPIAAGQVKPTTLSLIPCGKSLQLLASMQQLQQLTLWGPSRKQVHDLSRVLGYLPLLQSLSVKSYEASYEDSLEDSFGERALKVKIASPSLRTVDLGRVHPTSPELHMADLPALQQDLLDGIDLDLTDFGLHDTDDATSFSAACFLASWLSACPLDLNESASADGFTFETAADWSSEFLGSILCTALAPLRPFLATVSKLRIISLGVGEQGALSRLADAFSNVVWWDLQEVAMRDHDMEIWPVLQRLPKLESWRIGIEFVPPKDLLAALKWAADEGRSLQLVVLVYDNHENDDDLYDRLAFLADQVTRYQLFGPLVELIVLRGGF